MTRLVRVHSIHKTSSIDYHIDADVSGFLSGTQRQQFRGRYRWKLYPQGNYLSVMDGLGDQLDAYVQQYEWSKEHAS